MRCGRKLGHGESKQAGAVREAASCEAYRERFTAECHNYGRLFSEPAHAADQQPEERERFAITFYDHVASAHQGRPEGYGARPLRSTQPESRRPKAKDNSVSGLWQRGVIGS